MRKQLLDYLKETRIYWRLKEEALYRTLWETDFLRVCGPVVRQHVMAVVMIFTFWYSIPLRSCYRVGAVHV